MKAFTITSNTTKEALGEVFYEVSRKVNKEKVVRNKALVQKPFDFLFELSSYVGEYAVGLKDLNEVLDFLNTYSSFSVVEEDFTPKELRELLQESYYNAVDLEDEEFDAQA